RLIALKSLRTPYAVGCFSRLPALNSSYCRFHSASPQFQAKRAAPALCCKCPRWTLFGSSRTLWVRSMASPIGQRLRLGLDLLLGGPTFHERAPGGAAVDESLAHGVGHRITRPGTQTVPQRGARRRRRRQRREPATGGVELHARNSQQRGPLLDGQEVGTGHQGGVPLSDGHPLGIDGRRGGNAAAGVDVNDESPE